MSWKLLSWLSVLVVLISVLSLGCSSAERWRANRVSSGSSNEAFPRVNSQLPVTSLTTTPPTASCQLVSGQTSDPHAEHIRPPQGEVGHEFEPLPVLPAVSPEARDATLPPPQGQPLTLEFLEQLAYAHNPTLVQAQSQVQGELGKAIQAGLWPNPTLSYVQEQIGAEGTPGEFMGGTVSQRFVTANKLELSREKFLAQTRAAEWHALEQQYRVLNDVRMHYFRARGRYELMQIHQELLKSAEDSLLTTREQYNVGQATRAQVHLANVAVQQARLDLMMAENDYDQEFEELRALIGTDLPCAPLSTPLEGQLEPINWCDALSRLLTESPELLAAESKLESDRITVQRERVEPYPDVIVEGGVGYNYEIDQTVASAIVSLDVPLFDRNQGTIRQAEADLIRQQAEYRRIELTLQRDLGRVYRDYLTALQHAAIYQQEILPEARAAYELQLRSYEENRIAWPEVLHTQQEYFRLRAEYVRQLIAWRESEVLISGFLLHDGLMAPTSPPPAGHIDAVPKPR